MRAALHTDLYERRERSKRPQPCSEGSDDDDDDDIEELDGASFVLSSTLSLRWEFEGRF